MLAAVACGFILSGRALEPMSHITAEARKIGIQDLERRIPVNDMAEGGIRFCVADTCVVLGKYIRCFAAPDSQHSTLVPLDG